MKGRFLLVCTIFVLIMGMMTAVPAIAATNLITDGGFEAASAGFNLYSGTYWGKRSQSTAVVSSAAAKTGTKSALMTPIASTTSGGVEGLQAKNTVAITKEANLNEWFIVEAYEKAVSATPNANLQGKIALRISSAKLLQGPSQPLNNSTWSRCYLVFQATEANFVDGFKPIIGVSQTGSAAGETYSVYIDDISMHVVPAAQVQKPVGVESITIPASGSIGESYTAVVLNEFGKTEVSQRPTWSLASPHAGVSIDETTGVLTVSSTAQAGTVNVVASQDDVSSTALDVTLIAPIVGTYYDVTFDIGQGGSVKVAGKTITSASSSTDKVTSVAENGSVTLEFIPDAGKQVASVLYGSQDMTGDIVENQITFSNITANETVTVTFEQDPNLFKNNGFEAGVFDPWERYGSASTESISIENSVGNVKTGSYSLKATVAQKADRAYPVLGAVNKISRTDLDVTKRYQISAWIKTDSSDRTMIGQVWYRNSAGSGLVALKLASKAVTSADGWTELTFVLDPSKDVPAATLENVARIDIGIGGDALDPSGSFWIDDATMIELPPIIPVQPEINSDTTYNYFSNVNGTPTAYVYGKLNNFNVTSTDGYGMNLWVAGDPENSIQLPAMTVEGQPAIAQSNAPFVIKVYGSAIQTDESYVFQPYVGDTKGEEIPVEFEGE